MHLVGFHYKNSELYVSHSEIKNISLLKKRTQGKQIESLPSTFTQLLDPLFQRLYINSMQQIS